MKNPYSNRWINEVGADTRGMERKMMAYEARQSNELPVYECSKCGGECYHRPGVGGWWCVECGHLEVH